MADFRGFLWTIFKYVDLSESQTKTWAVSITWLHPMVAGYFEISPRKKGTNKIREAINA